MNSHFLPVSGSLILLLRSKDEEPVAITFNCGMESAINFNVRPIFSIL